jgi:hypothetical protein
MDDAVECGMFEMWNLLDMASFLWDLRDICIDLVLESLDETALIDHELQESKRAQSHIPVSLLALSWGCSNGLKLARASSPRICGSPAPPRA